MRFKNILFIFLVVPFFIWGMRTSKDPFMCGITLENNQQCPFTASKLTLMIRHRFIHTEQKPFTCIDCQKEMTQAGWGYHKRVNTHHQMQKTLLHAQTAKIINYPIQRASAKSSNEVVKEIVNNKVDFVCDIELADSTRCTFTAPKKYAIHSHRFTHTDQNELTCSGCNKELTRTGGNMHISNKHLHSIKPTLIKTKLSPETLQIIYSKMKEVPRKRKNNSEDSYEEFSDITDDEISLQPLDRQKKICLSDQEEDPIFADLEPIGSITDYLSK